MIREENRAEREVLSRTTSLFVKKKNYHGLQYYLYHHQHIIGETIVRAPHNNTHKSTVNINNTTQFERNSQNFINRFL